VEEFLSYTQNLSIPYDRIANFCQKHHIQKLSLFGSALRHDFGIDSDVDVLVEFEPGQTPGWEIVSIENELSTLLGRKVDFRTPQELSRYFRQRVLDTAEPIYDKHG
jgi:predicted nucleotidyltransferase